MRSSLNFHLFHSFSGGNLPVDGMLFLEFIPAANQYLLTLLSVFWSIGQLFASLIAWAFIANYSCSATQTNVPSDLAKNPTWTACAKADNMGWRYTFYTLGAMTFILFVFRFVIFQLPESPKYLSEFSATSRLRIRPLLASLSLAFSFLSTSLSRQGA